MNNATDLKFSDVSSEEYREYHFPERNVRIDNPLCLNVSESGGHRILDAAGISHYIPPKWIHLEWKAKEGQPNFVGEVARIEALYLRKQPKSAEQKSRLLFYPSWLAKVRRDEESQTNNT